ncbi:MAG: hypothetical protein ACSHXZ_01645 [Gammaproteobacteria bacterium]
MLFSSALTVSILFAVILGSLLIVRLTQDRQERQLIRLYRLAALDRRSSALRKVLQGLKAFDDNPEVIRILTQALKGDMQRIQILDPARSVNEKEARQGDSAKAEKPSAANTATLSKVDQKTSFGTEQEVMKARAHITDALALIRHLYQVGHVKGEQLESTARHLGTLSALVGVNSNIRMAEEAFEHGDSRKAFSHYRAAESYLVNGPLNGPEGASKLSYIQQRKTFIANAELSEQEAYTRQAA